MAHGYIVVPLLDLSLDLALVSRPSYVKDGVLEPELILQTLVRVTHPGNLPPIVHPAYQGFRSRFRNARASRRIQGIEHDKDHRPGPILYRLCMSSSANLITIVYSLELWLTSDRSCCRPI